MIMETSVVVALIAGMTGLLTSVVSIILNVLLGRRVSEIDSASKRKLTRLNKGLDSAEQLMIALADLDNAMRGLIFYVESTGVTTSNFNQVVGPIAAAADKVRRYSFLASLYWGDEVIELCDQISSMCQAFSFNDVHDEKHPKKVHPRIIELSRRVGKVLASNYLRGETSIS
jgi:hypothetical protein